MKISIGADHRGFSLKESIKKQFSEIEWLDVGTHDEARTDYPLYAQRVTDAVLSGLCDRGILICGSGIGIAMAANRVKKIYAALCWNPAVARVARAHDGCNVLVLPADFITHDVGAAIITAWLETPFEGGRYQERLNMIDKEK